MIQKFQKHQKFKILCLDGSSRPELFLERAVLIVFKIVPGVYLQRSASHRMTGSKFENIALHHKFLPEMFWKLWDQLCAYIREAVIEERFLPVLTWLFQEIFQKSRMQVPESGFPRFYRFSFYGGLYVTCVHHFF